MITVSNTKAHSFSRELSLMYGEKNQVIPRKAWKPATTIEGDPGSCIMLCKLKEKDLKLAGDRDYDIGEGVFIRIQSINNKIGIRGYV